MRRPHDVVTGLLEHEARLVRTAVRTVWAALVAGAIVAATDALVPFTGRPFFFVAFPLVMLSALAAGTSAGVLTSMLATIAFSVRYFQPLGDLWVSSRADAVRLAGFAICAILVAVACGALRSAYRRERQLRGAAVVTAATLAERTRDLTRAIEAQKQSERALEEAAGRKDEFLAMLGHELRNPLAAMRNAVVIAGRADATEEQRSRAGVVLGRQLDQLARLVDDLLDVTRIARGKIHIAHEPVNVGDLLRHVVEDHRSLFAERRIALDLQLAADPAVWVTGDSIRLSQMIGNLLHNAAKFTDGGGSVSVVLARRDGHATVTVRDDGVGIEADILARLFTPFTQADATLSRSRGGLGLGLNLVKGIAELHGGSVRVSSAGRGKGSEFEIALPISAAPPAATLPLHPPAAATRRGRCVLIVDDNEDAAVTLADIVETFGHATEVVGSGDAALARARESRPDAVLCDIGLPGMSGYEVARALRAEHGDAILLVALSGYAQPEDVRKALDSGFDAHVAKPPDLGRIEQLLRQDRPAAQPLAG